MKEFTAKCKQLIDASAHTLEQARELGRLLDQKSKTYRQYFYNYNFSMFRDVNA
jgi:hypothetical protein